MQFGPGVFVIVRVKFLIRVQPIHVPSHLVDLFIAKFTGYCSGPNFLLKLQNLFVYLLATQFARGTFNGEIFCQYKS